MMYSGDKGRSNPACDMWQVKISYKVRILKLTVQCHKPNDRLRRYCTRNVLVRDDSASHPFVCHNKGFKLLLLKALGK